MIYYAGIGSRETPDPICMKMTKFASCAEMRGMILRSGGADGADLAFEKGVSDPKNKHIFLPWQGFNGSDSLLYQFPSAKYYNEAYDIAAEFHPKWKSLSRGVKQLHVRNVCQILGNKLDAPSKFVVCWTPEGKGGGGTGQAIRIARSYKIPVFDYGVEGSYFVEQELNEILSRGSY